MCACSTRLKALIQSRCAAYLGSPYDPRSDAQYKEFEDALQNKAPQWGGSGAGEQDEDCMVEPTQGQLAPNQKCPISQKEVGCGCRWMHVRLRGPVQSRTGLVEGAPSPLAT